MAHECSQFCDDVEEKCLVDCKGDASCDVGCRFDAVDCTYHCPCYPGCPSGCGGCPSSFCQCNDFESSPDFLACEKYFEEVYTACIVGCDIGDVLCLAACGREHDANLLNCPCMSNCINGCPCDNYECPQATTTASITTMTTTATTATTTSTTMTTTTVAPCTNCTSVLILNSYYTSNQPVLTDASGRVDTNLDFTRDKNTIVYKSCSVIFKNQYYVYGGVGSDYNRSRQISQIDGCRLRRLGDLPFYHIHATCTAGGDDRIYLCFNSYYFNDDLNRCRFATQPEGPFYDVPRSNHGHIFARIASSPSNFTSLLD